MPVPGDVDVVLASELMEAARAVERGFVTPDKTLLIASTDRVFAITEKIALADGQADAAALLAARRDGGAPAGGVRHGGARRGDRERVERSAVRRAGGRGGAALSRTAFEAAIRRGKVGVTGSLAAFGAAFEAARAGEAAVAAPRARRWRRARYAAGALRVGR